MSESKELRHAPLEWAQRSDKLYLTIAIPDVKDPEIKLEPVDGHGRLYFKGEGGGGLDREVYELDIELYGEIDPDSSKISVGARHIVLQVAKKESGPHWPRLLAATGKPPAHIKVDWAKYKDEDEENEPDNFDLGAMSDLSQFMGKEGDQDEDSDDEDPPEMTEDE